MIMAFIWAICWLFVVCLVAVIAGVLGHNGPYGFNPFVWEALVGTVPATVVLVAEYAIASRVKLLAATYRPHYAISGIMSFLIGLGAAILPNSDKWGSGNVFGFYFGSCYYSTLSAVFLILSVLSARLWSWTNGPPNYSPPPSNSLTRSEAK